MEVEEVGDNGVGDVYGNESGGHADYYVDDKSARSVSVPESLEGLHHLSRQNRRKRMPPQDASRVSFSSHYEF